MISMRLLICFVAFWCISHALNNALLFNWKEQKLVEMRNLDKEAVCESCISACPASNSQTEELRKYGVSVTGNVIFLKDFYPLPITAGEMKIEICEKPLSPTLVWDRGVVSFQVGYEMYYEEGQVDLKTSKYDQYLKVVEGVPSIKPTESPSEDTKIKIYKQAENTKFELDDQPGKTLVFYFINVLSIDVFNADKTRAVTFVRDTINDYRHQIWTISECKTYFMGDKTSMTYEKQETEVPIQMLLKELLAKDAQPDTKVLPQEPETSTRQPKTPANRLIKTQILPMRMFHTLAGRLATCMYLNIAFVWEPIANGQLRKIDLFLYALYRVFPSQIKLSFTVSGELQGIETNVREEISTEHPLFTKYPVPELIFRFVEIKVAGKLHGAVVVIHNNLESVPDINRICPANEEVEGWGDIRNTNASTGYSYVCKQNPQVFKKLGEGNASEDMIPLKLNNLPYIIGTNGQIEYKSVLDRINNELIQINELHIEY